MKGMGNMGHLMKQVKKLQEEMERKQAEINEMRLDASSGGGMVTATVNGRGKLHALKIEAEVIDPEDPEMLVDLILAAVQQAQRDAEEKSEELLGPLAQGMPGVMP